MQNIFANFRFFFPGKSSIRRNFTTNNAIVQKQSDLWMRMKRQKRNVIDSAFLHKCVFNTQTKLYFSLQMSNGMLTCTCNDAICSQYNTYNDARAKFTLTKMKRKKKRFFPKFSWSLTVFSKFFLSIQLFQTICAVLSINSSLVSQYAKSAYTNWSGLRAQGATETNIFIVVYFFLQILYFHQNSPITRIHNPIFTTNEFFRWRSHQNICQIGHDSHSYFLSNVLTFFCELTQNA